MNERIKELAEQAGLKYHNWSTNESNIIDGEFKYPRLEDYIKFAELIVQECLGIVENNNPCPPGTIKMYSLLQDEYFDKGWQVAAETKSNQIKKHFGVEE